jgi:thioredoxin reductase (NADPH)
MYDCIVIGGGPAAQQTGLFLGRAKLSALLIGDPKKSDLAYGKVIGNYFGVSDEPTGLSLLTKGLDHLQRCGVEIVEEEVVDVKKDDDGFTVTTASMKSYQAKAVVIASGRQLPTAGIKNEKEFLGKGVATCVACDGPLFKGKTVAVVGWGSHAAEEAIELRAYTDRVTIYTQGKKLEMNEALKKKLDAEGVAISDKKIAAVEGETLLKKIVFKDGTSEPMDGLFVAVGSAGGITFGYKLGLELENTFIKIDRDGKTNIPGVWAAGGCTGGNPQIAKSVGEGCNAAISVIRTLKGLAEYKDQT